MDNLLNFFLIGLQKLEHWSKKCIENFSEKRIELRMLNKSRVWSLLLVSFLVGVRTYQHPLVLTWW